MEEQQFNAYRIRELIKELNENTAKYELGEPTIPDTEWDKMYFELKELEATLGIIYPNSPTQIIHYNVVNELKKVEHNHPMLSLDKTKNWDEFIQYFANYDVVVMPKLDGLTCSLRYLGGKLVSAETRGNGKIGEDVLHNLRILSNVPQNITFKGEYIVDGEVICTYKDFEPFKQKYANPRNFASGSIRLLSASECSTRKLRFVLWNVVKGIGTNNFIKELEAAEDLGFEIVPWTSGFDWDAKDFLIDRAKEEGYPIDGLVGRFNDIAYGKSLGSTGHHSRAAYAFKFADELYDTKLLDIEWSMGRTGQLTPVAIFEPVDTGESVITKANLHNLNIMDDILGYPYVGQSIKIYQANMIIPQLYSANKPDMPPPEYLQLNPPKICPICGAETKDTFTIDSHLLICSNPLCDGKLINKLDHFLGKKGLDIKGISSAILDKLIEWEWVNNFCDLFNLAARRSEWIKKPGFGVKSVDKILNTLEAGRTTTLQKFISAIGIPLIGKTASIDLLPYIKDYKQFRYMVNTKYDFTKIPGFGIEKSNAILNFNYEEADKVSELLTFVEEEQVEITSESLAGQSICITGTLIRFKNRSELTDIIIKNGGKVVSSVSKNTTMLINNNLNSTSAKNKAAKTLGIPIITEEKFLEMI